MSSTQVTSDVLRSRHLTIPAPAAAAEKAALVTFVQLAARLQQEGIIPLQEKIYGPAAEREAVLRVRREIFTRSGLDPELPCTYTSGRRGEDLGLGGVQLWGIAPLDGAAVSVSTITGGAGVRGRLLESSGQRMLWLSDVRGRDEDGNFPSGVADQGTRMFENAQAVLQQYGFDFPNVVRTWIYLTRILDWYGEFNRVRKEFLNAHGITDDARFPASTGIQGTGGEGECLMDVLAVSGAGVSAGSITESSRQRRPMSYGSSFSRGMSLECGPEEIVFVSGTASIDAEGQTLHCWQREAQIVETLLSIAALLEDQGGSLRDIKLATLFCKDRETLDVFARVTRQLGTTQLPVIPVLADVCRPELMVEIEALAVLPVGRGEEVAP